MTARAASNLSWIEMIGNWFTAAVLLFMKKNANSTSFLEINIGNDHRFFYFPLSYVTNDV